MSKKTVTKTATQTAEEKALTEKLREVFQGGKRYNPGDKVQQVDAVLVEGIERSKGEVVRQDSGSNLVFVAWNDGCKYWTDVQCIEPAPEKRKKSKG